MRMGGGGSGRVRSFFNNHLCCVCLLILGCPQSTSVTMNACRCMDILVRATAVKKL